jgi:hypothetical protein
VLQHPFLEKLYDPVNDPMIMKGDPIELFQFEFEQYRVPREIMKELVVDEIILLNSKEAQNSLK